MTETQQLVGLRVNPEYEALLPKLSEEEYEALKLSIKTEGQHYPIVINSQAEILDGHHRWKICRELEHAPKIETKIFPNKLLEQKFVIEVNLRRRHLNTFQKVELAIPLLTVEAELAKQRQEATLPKEGEKGFQPMLGSNEPHIGRARNIVASQVGVSPTTFQRAIKILNEGSEQLKFEVRSGHKTIFSAYHQLQREIPREYAPIPEGKYDIIYADPPWQYDFSLSDMGDAESFYPTLPTEELCNLRVPSAENALLFLWATNPKLEDALNVMRAWGFTYKTNMVWVKDRWGTGYYFRGQHELLLVGKKGNPLLPEQTERTSSVLATPKSGHSKKPKEIYELIEKLYPNRKYIELFATSQRENWVSWGNDL